LIVGIKFTPRAFYHTADRS